MLDSATATHGIIHISFICYFIREIDALSCSTSGGTCNVTQWHPGWLHPGWLLFCHCFLACAEPKAVMVPLDCLDWLLLVSFAADWPTMHGWLFYQFFLDSSLLSLLPPYRLIFCFCTPGSWLDATCCQDDCRGKLLCCWTTQCRVFFIYDGKPQKQWILITL